MSNKEILEKAIRIAIKNGFGNKGYDWLDAVMSDSFDADVVPKLIYNHDFAKGLWDRPNLPDAHFYIEDKLSYRPSNWKWHLQQMVIASDPIKYLGEHLND